ncbi:MAG: LysR family transcriptional regulator [Oscillospiraceae bacterium]|nr:LysR family transcriptional regulator [Oscillospiraceae bacterium]MBQ3224678.1 LysR family transcriptional regulator [Oscillospiraceae bacterium]MBQ4316489.1 LysR family transcriptional regulator [Oscillospiraceae bacterium]MBQ6697491.1 LysR family transcriptional regulator [Oscillospiraceae bacterium]MBQ7054511.1 LysR family transcriptional regulator [Oscillospiraceae bacterium]
MVNFLNLKYFVRVAEEKNITRVAEQEHISQQSLSNHIKKIEAEYGVQLFDRTGGLTLTYAGEQMYNYAVKFLSLRHDMENELLDMENTEQGTLRIGISYTRGSAFLPDILPEFCAQNPFVKISIVENNSQMLEEYLLHGHIDLYIGADMRPHAEIETIELMHEKLYFIVPEKIAGRLGNDAYNICDLEKEPFLLLSRGNRIRDMFDEYMRKENINVRVSLEAENIETLFELACKGMGITVYPEMFLRRHRDVLNSAKSPVTVIPLGDKFSESVLFIAYHKNKYRSRAAKSFIQTARESCG